MYIQYTYIKFDDRQEVIIYALIERSLHLDILIIDRVSMHNMILSRPYESSLFSYRLSMTKLFIYLKLFLVYRLYANQLMRLSFRCLVRC